MRIVALVAAAMVAGCAANAPATLPVLANDNRTPALDVEVSMLQGDKTLEWQPIAKDGAAFASRRAQSSSVG